jgi:hypothetical protein
MILLDYLIFCMGFALLNRVLASLVVFLLACIIIYLIAIHYNVKELVDRSRKG